MLIQRHFTSDAGDPFAGLEFEERACRITEKDGTVVYDLGQIVVPKQWSHVSVNVLAHKYMRKAGVPSAVIPDPECASSGIPSWLTPSVAADDATFGVETDCRQVFHRLAGCWAYWGWNFDYFDDEEAKVFYDELKYMLARQIWAPNSPQWFNTGLHWAYGIEGPEQGHWHQQGRKGHVTQSVNGYERPQVHACYIQGVGDALVRPGGIMDLFSREARLFKMGGGTGSNMSNLRGEGEPLSGGGRSSGLMSFLGVGDRSAGAIKSGGTTRRAAKMVVLDADHPDVEKFIDWKLVEERKVAALIAGSQLCKKHARRLQKACQTKNEKQIRIAAQKAALQGVPPNLIRRVIQRAKISDDPIEFEVYDSHWEGEGYRTVAGQNANNSIRVPQELLDAMNNGDEWPLYRRTDRQVAKTISARVLWKKIVETAWACADPGLQFSTTINEWNPVPNDEEIRGSNPCAEYLFLDDTACNLASSNLLAFLRDDGSFDIPSFISTCILSTIVLDISVSMAQYPYELIARKSLDYRTLGMGYANLGALLMCMGYSYDSDAGRAIAASITSLMGAAAQRTSADLARLLEPYPAYERNKEHHQRVVRNHGAAVLGGDFTDLTYTPQRINKDNVPPRYHDILLSAKTLWRNAIEFGIDYGFRNAQVTCLAPTGTIGLVMGCDTTGVEPDFALQKYKTLAGGGHMVIVNQAVPRALDALNYTGAEIRDISAHIKDTGGMGGAPHLKLEHLPIFDCANACGDSTRALEPMAHIAMMAAVQPFLSGGISKTVNLSTEATMEDVGDVYMAAWTLGLKCISVYRDLSKLSQPLQTAEDPFFQKYLESSSEDENEDAPFSNRRHSLPAHRVGYTQKLRVSKNNFYLRTGQYEDGSLGEIFLDSAKSGTMVKAMLNCFAIAVSLGLQHGVPLDEYVDAFTYTHFEPSGFVHGHDNIKMCSSILDAIFRDLGFRYLEREDLVHIKSSNEDAASSADVQHTTIATKKRAESQGYEGIPCQDCGNMTMVRAGTCLSCVVCGTTTGCS